MCVYALHAFYLISVYIDTEIQIQIPVLQVYRLSDKKDLSGFSNWMLHWFPGWIFKSIYIEIEFFLVIRKCTVQKQS